VQTIEERGEAHRDTTTGTVTERRAPEAPAGCGVCGFERPALPAPDTIAAILGLPGAFRAIFTGSGRGSDPGRHESIDDAVRARPTPDGWSAIEYAAHVAEVLHETAMRLVLIFEGAGRVLPPPHTETANASARSASRVAVLASLGAGATELARVVSSAPEGAWDLSAKRCDTRVSARDLLGEALHEAHHHLFDAREALRARVAPVGTTGRDVRP
jgi:hypothetical protein